MCGIGGVLGSRPLEGAATQAQRIAASLVHRGPDGEGFLGITDAGKAILCRAAQDLNGLCLQGVLVHRRLSIIDLATGDQPMALADGSAWIVFNGEIYNYAELRRDLAAVEDLPFRTQSDTEVILRVYRRWGIDGFRRLNGIFAFALYDTTRRELILARDPVGVKPLYWTASGGAVWFASEISTLHSGGVVDRSIAPDALAQFLYYRFVPAPATLWTAVRKVIPGHALRFDASGRNLGEVDFAAPAPAPRHVEVAPEELEERFSHAVRRQLLADVPVGAFLSGGLDSSLLIGALGAQAAGFPTFAVGFADAPGHPSELAAAAWAAQVFGTHHSARAVEPTNYFARMPWAVARTEEPLAHPGMSLQADLSALARGTVKVVLTGQGADEPLGGYPRHQAARTLPLLAGLMSGVARSTWVTAWGKRREVVARIRRVLLARPGLERAAALFSPLAPEDVGAMVKGCGPENGRTAVLSGIERWWIRSAGLDDLARTLYVDVRTSLADDLLLVTDKMSMAHSLEARVPYLDLDYLSYLEGIPGPQRVGIMGRRKPLQQVQARRLLPRALQRSLRSSTSPWRRKHGFDVPVADWFRNVLRSDIQDFLTGSGSAIPEFLDLRVVRHTISSFLQGSGRSYRQVLSLYVLEIWLRANVVQDGRFFGECS
jgi:asparagine synthase (glutamine-hydrolysing)